METISTVGYGDYVAGTQIEIIYAMILELMGVLLFAMMMFSMDSVFKRNVDYDVIINEKNEETDNWLKKLEKCN
jgi:hypothetical protein